MRKKKIWLMTSHVRKCPKMPSCRLKCGLRSPYGRRKSQKNICGVECQDAQTIKNASRHLGIKCVIFGKNSLSFFWKKQSQSISRPVDKIQRQMLYRSKHIKRVVKMYGRIFFYVITLTCYELKSAENFFLCGFSRAPRWVDEIDTVCVSYRDLAMMRI